MKIFHVLQTFSPYFCKYLYHIFGEILMNYILDHSLSLPHLEIVKLDIKLLFGEGRNLLLGWMLSILHDVSILLVSELA